MRAPTPDAIAISAMALGAILMSGAAQETTKFTAKEAALQSAANGGLFPRALPRALALRFRLRYRPPPWISPSS